MIQPVDTLSPKVLFKGEFGKLRKPPILSPGKTIAMFNAGGISAAIGGTMAIVGRSYTSSWKTAFSIGLVSAAAALTFLIPRFLYKAGIGISKRNYDTDKFVQENGVQSKFRKLLANS